MKLIATIVRLLIGGMLCYFGSLAAFTGVSNLGVLARSDGLTTRVGGLFVIIIGALFIFNRLKKTGSHDEPES